MPKISDKKVLQSTADEKGEWETVVDFTDRGKRVGMPAKDVLKILRKMKH
jgi:hypothetical protein